MIRNLIPALMSIGLFIGTSLGVTISGTVTDSAATTPVNKAIVQLRSGNRLLGTDTTDVQGAYSITVTDTTGKCTIRAIQIGTYYTKIVDTTLSSAPLIINIAISKIIVATISGVVKDSVAGTTLTGAVVTLGFGVNARRDTTGADGVYSFSDVKTGNQTVSVTCPNYIGKSIKVAVAGITPVKQDFALVALIVTSVSGIVTDRAKGTPLPGVIVRIYTNRTNKYDTTGADGKYQFAEVGTGSVIMIINATGFVVLRDTLTISGTAPVTHNIALSSRTTVNLQQLSKGSTAPFIVLSSGKLAVTNISSAVKLTIFNLNGKCVYKTVFDKNSGAISLPSSILHSSGQSLVARISVEGKSWTQQILSAK